MFQYITKTTRKNTNSSFYLFQSDNIDFLITQAKYRDAVCNAPGFVSLSIEVSQDKLNMYIITTWETEADAREFNTKFNSKFKRNLGEYLRRTKHTTITNTQTVVDTTVQKSRKIAQEMTVQEARLILEQEINKDLYHEQPPSNETE